MQSTYETLSSLPQAEMKKALAIELAKCILAAPGNPFYAKDGPTILAEASETLAAKLLAIEPPNEPAEPQPDPLDALIAEARRLQGGFENRYANSNTVRLGTIEGGWLADFAGYRREGSTREAAMTAVVEAMTRDLRDIAASADKAAANARAVLDEARP